MKIRITMEVIDELADPHDPTGLTADAFQDLHDALSSFGEDVDIERCDE